MFRNPRHPEQPKPQKPQTPNPAAPLRVLIVDDNETAAASIKSAIEDFGDDVRACFNGLDALKLAAIFRPEVLLLDIAMPGIDGLQVAQTLRGDPTFAGLKIIAQTGFGDGEVRRRTASAGFDLHLLKPISLQVLEDIFTLLRTGPRQLAGA